jgi:hypothetical protein
MSAEIAVDGGAIGTVDTGPPYSVFAVIDGVTTSTVMIDNPDATVTASADSD